MHRIQGTYQNSKSAKDSAQLTSVQGNLQTVRAINIVLQLAL